MGFLGIDLGLKGLLAEKEKEIEVILTEKQEEVIASNSDRLVVSGGFGSGKTFLGAVWLKKQLDKQKTVAIIVSPSLPTLRRNMMPALERVGVTNTQLDMASSFYYKGSRVYCLGLDNIRSIKRIRGMDCGIFYANEASFLHEEAFSEGMSRLRLSPNKAFLETNPDSPSHWLFEKVIKNTSFTHFSFSTLDNTRLGVDLEKYISENIMAKEGSNFYRRMVLGEWIEGDDLPFANMRLCASPSGLWDFAVIDPSLEGGDLTAMTLFLRTEGRGWIVKGFCEKLSYDEFLGLARVQSALKSCHKVFLETNILGTRAVNSLKPFCEKAFGLKTTSNKVARIVKCSYPVHIGNILFDNTSDRAYIEGVSRWTMSKGKNQVDDHIDSLALGLEYWGVL